MGEGVADDPNKKDETKKEEGEGKEGAGGNQTGNQRGRGRNTFTEVEVELGDNRNRSVLFPLTQERYRGAWRREFLIADEMVEEIAGMPDIPGMRVRIDPQRRRVVVYDPLSLPENAELCRRVQAFVKKLTREDQGPDKLTEHTLKSDNEVKGWLYWTRRLVDARRARVTQGTLPTLEEIERLAGKTRIENFNSSARACKFKEDQDAWIEAVLDTGRAPKT